MVGNTQDLPYFNSLIREYGLATNYYANTHPSVNNYFILTAGHAGFSSLWTSDGFLANLHAELVPGENIASILTDNRKTWKAYLEGLPEAGSLTSNHAGYVKRHDPFAYFTTVVGGDRDHSPQKSNLVPFEPNFEKDLQNHTFPNYSFIVPDIHDDGHDNAKTHREAGLRRSRRIAADRPVAQPEHSSFGRGCRFQTQRAADHSCLMRLAAEDRQPTIDLIPSSHPFAAAGIYRLSSSARKQNQAQGPISSSIMKAFCVCAFARLEFSNFPGPPRMLPMCAEFFAQP